MRGRGDVEAEPGDGDGAKDVAVGECEDIAAGACRELDESLSSLVDLSRRLAARAAVVIQLPIRP